MGVKRDLLPNIWTILIIFTFSVTEILGARQAITVYTDSRCSDNPVVYMDTVNIDETSSAWNATSFKIVGLWKITGVKEVIIEGTTTERSEMQYKEKIFAKRRSYNGNTCLGKYDLDFYGYNITKFEKFGPAETSKSTLMLFSKMNLEGEWDTVNDELRHVLSNEIQCFAQFSDKHWIYYPEALFKGEPQCLCAYYDWWADAGKGTEMGFDGFQYFNTQPAIKIGSVKVDKENLCDCPYSSGFKPSTTTMPPYRTTTYRDHFYDNRGFDYNYLYFLFLLLIPLTCVIYCCIRQTTFERREIVIKFGTGPPPAAPTGMNSAPPPPYSNLNTFTSQTNTNQKSV